MPNTPPKYHWLNKPPGYMDALRRLLELRSRGYVKRGMAELRERLEPCELDSCLLGEPDAIMETVDLSDYAIRKMVIAAREERERKQMLNETRRNRKSAFRIWYEQSAWTSPFDCELADITESESYRDALRAYRLECIGRKPKKQISARF